MIDGQHLVLSPPRELTDLSLLDPKDKSAWEHSKATCTMLELSFILFYFFVEGTL